jgi:hypothetical protein
MKKIEIVPVEFTPVTKFNAKEKCKTCAYHRPSSAEEDEMTIAYWHDHPVPHQCHERQNGWACKGAVESCIRLGLMEAI